MSMQEVCSPGLTTRPGMPVSAFGRDASDTATAPVFAVLALEPEPVDPRL